MKHLFLFFLAFINVLACKSNEKKMYGKRPNILWIMIENYGQDISCYGTKGINTPNIDRLAKEGIRFNNSFCTSSVCSPSRSAMMTGFQQIYIECNQHRAMGPGFQKKKLPFNIQPLTHLLETAGYFTCLMDGKDDCNFIAEKPLFMGKDWSERKDGQPFYAQLSLKGTDNWYRPRQDTLQPVDLNVIKIPPYYPDLPLTRREYANAMEGLQRDDSEIGKLLKRLDDEGLTENTLVFFIADNGLSMPRGMHFLYDEGIKIPMIARWPGYIKPHQVNHNMVMTIDITATILDVAGVNPGYELHGKNLFGKAVKEREYVFSSRDKMDWTFDAIRAVRSKKFKLIQNLMPERAYCQYNEYKEGYYPVLALLNMMNLKNELTPSQAKLMAPSKPEIEMYDLVNDPFELNNLADDPKYQKNKQELLSVLQNWRKSVNDNGVSEEFRKGGWPSTYPTRSLAEWTAIVEKWKTWMAIDPRVKAPAFVIDPIPGALLLNEINSKRQE
jgi:arylsulfatase A-like enzyme